MGAGRPATAVKGEGPGDPTRNEARNFTLTYAHRDLLGGSLTLQGFYYDFYALYGGDTFPVFQDPTIAPVGTLFDQRSEEHTSELQSLMRISYAVFCLKKKLNQHNHTNMFA